MRKCFKIQVGLEGEEWDEVDVSKEWWGLDLIQKSDVGGREWIYIYIYICVYIYIIMIYGDMRESSYDESMMDIYWLQRTTMGAGASDKSERIFDIVQIRRYSIFVSGDVSYD